MKNEVNLDWDLPSKGGETITRDYALYHSVRKAGSGQLCSWEFYQGISPNPDHPHYYLITYSPIDQQNINWTILTDGERYCYGEVVGSWVHSEECEYESLNENSYRFIKTRPMKKRATPTKEEIQNLMDDEELDIPANAK